MINRRRGFSLVELLVSLAIIAFLMAILLPALGRARGQARQVVCAAHLGQLGQGFHLYAADYLGKAMPLAYSDRNLIGDGPAIYWWGTNEQTRVDHTRGFVWPYLQSDLRANGLYECPDQSWDTYIPQGEARAVTSTYGYNGYYLCPPHTPGWADQIGRRPWRNLDLLSLPQRLFVFADTLLDFDEDRPRNVALLDPPYLYSGGHWSANGSPTTAFRHAGLAVAVFADGHAEATGPRGGKITSPQFRIGSVGKTNDPHYVPDWREW